MIAAGTAQATAEERRRAEAAVALARAKRVAADARWARRTWLAGDPADPDPRRRPGRPGQMLPPPQTPDGVDWLVWLMLAGRGYGKTRSAAEASLELIHGGEWRNPALVGATAADVRDVMVRGRSGILACCPADWQPVYQSSQRRILFPNGAIATLYSAEEPNRLRGPGHDGAWVDELAAWRHPDAFDMLSLGLREGRNPRLIATTTPRPIRIIRELLADPTTVVTRGTTHENLGNLAASFARRILGRYEGTRLGRQELYAELLDDLEGAFWTSAMFEATRVAAPPRDPDGRLLLSRVVVTIDPATSHGEDSDQTGIAVAGRGFDGRLYLLHAEGVRLSPRGWATRALDLYDRYEADRIIAERNAGGEMVEATIRSVRESAPVDTINASRGKTVRAEPVAALYEQGRVSHVGYLGAAEDQMASFPVDPDAGDDIVDAVVYALTALVDVPERPLAGIVAVGSARGWQPRR